MPRCCACYALLLLTAHATPLHDAAAEDDAGQIAKLIEAGSPTDTLDENKMTPLHVASYWGSTDAVTALLSSGAALEAWAPGVRMTPLHWACSQGHVEAARALLAAGAAGTSTAEWRRPSTSDLARSAHRSMPSAIFFISVSSPLILTITSQSRVAPSVLIMQLMVSDAMTGSQPPILKTFGISSRPGPTSWLNDRMKDPNTPMVRPPK